MLTEWTFEVMWIYPVLTMAIGISAGYLSHLFLVRAQAGGDAKRARALLKDAEQKAESLLRETELNRRDTQIRLREQFEIETRDRRRELEAQQHRLEKRETNVDRRMALMDHKEQNIEKKVEELLLQEQELAEEVETAARTRKDALQQLARISDLTPEAARAEMLSRIEKEGRAEAVNLLHHIQEETRAAATERAREILVTAIERYAAGHVSEITTTSVRLPNEEMKGRIIGRDGRNIRSFEMETGCNVLIDDTPGMAVVSAFDPIRREVARVALEKLIEDGRIHPARIEEVVAEVRADTEAMIRSAGEEAVRELSLPDVAPELLSTLGKLRYRFSFAQNVLRHSIEVAHVMGMMAAEIGLDPALARRVGLFHDLGKAVDHEVEGGHAEIGADLLRRHGEPAEVVNGVAAHHHEVASESPYAALAAAADAVTAARPGARAENVDMYLQRLSQIESIASGCRGVRHSFAVQSGRELRVLVAPEEIDDTDLSVLAREISRRLTEEVRFPGQIRVTVIRETRSVEYAR